MTRPKLLLADDSVTIRKVVELTFADEGIDVTAVADGDAAMAKFVEIQPDVVLVDVGLTGTSGYQICEMIKTDEATSHIPVLLLVGSFEPFDQDAAERAGADGFLTKPFHSIRDLVARVNDLLGISPSSTDGGAPFAAGPNGDSQDINELYERSFVETQPIENYETVPAFAADDPFAGASPSVGSEEIHELAETRPEATDPWLDDEMIEAVSSDVAVEPEATETPEDDVLPTPEEETVEAVSQYDEAPAPEVDIEPIKEFDWSPAAIVTAADEAEIGAAAGFTRAFISEEPFLHASPEPVEHMTEELQDLTTDEMPELAEADNGLSDVSPADELSTGTLDTGDEDAPSREFIDLVARRVVERLSDRVIREIAQEAVPRIAEKLMREALDEENKT